MIIVIIALLPALLFGMYNVGYQHFAAIADPVSQAMWFKCWWYGFVRMLPMILVSYIVGLGIEFAVAQHKGEEVNEGFLVTGLLIPMIMPIDIPLGYWRLPSHSRWCSAKSVRRNGHERLQPGPAGACIRLLCLYAEDFRRTGVDSRFLQGGGVCRRVLWRYAARVHQ